jgi:hypothetical protein
MRAERANSNCGGRRGKGCGCWWTQHWVLLPAAPSDTRGSLGGTGLRITPDTGLASRHLEAHRAIRHTNFGQYCGGAC